MLQCKRVAVLVASLSNGGVGKDRSHLINEFAERGLAVDLLTARPDSPYLGGLHPRVRVIDIGTSHAITSIPPLVWYLRRQRPDAMLTERIRVNVAALRARRLAASRVPIFATLNTNLSRLLESLRPSKQGKQLAMMRRYYPLNDGLIAVSAGVAEDAATLIGYPRERIQTIVNPIITRQLYAKSQEAVDHPWFGPAQPPVILGVGRLQPEKDFATLLRAFARLRQQRDCRLLILGDGNLRSELLALAEELGVRSCVDMPGFVDNPYAYMARAKLFVLSSLREGFSNALAEALAVGIPVVATDCPSGPREVLDNGRYGPLVPVGDPLAMAEAMGYTLDNPLAADVLRNAVRGYTLAASADGYLTCLGLT